MKSTRQRFQAGCLRKVARKTGSVWEYRYRDNSQPGSPLRQRTLSTTLYPTESKALAALQPMLLKINGEEAFVQKRQTTFGTLIDHYIEAIASLAVMQELLILLQSQESRTAFRRSFAYADSH